jgi:hypothetical protein
MAVLHFAGGQCQPVTETTEAYLRNSIETGAANFQVDGQFPSISHPNAFPLSVNLSGLHLRVNKTKEMAPGHRLLHGERFDVL